MAGIPHRRGVGAVARVDGAAVMPSGAPLSVAYLALLAILAPFGFHRLWLLWLRFRPPGARRKSGGVGAGMRSGRPGPEQRHPPVVTVQIPVYDEANVVARAIDAACRIEYPRDRLEVQILDDSDDETAAIAARRVAAWRHRGVDVSHRRRASREGYKAGALAAGSADARGDFFLVLDADFVPPPGLVHRLLSSFDAPDVGFVQAAWSHLNGEAGWLARAQALLLDAHFAVEHAARSRAGLFFNFNGTAGMWRRACLEAVGGWSGATLTEDLELSYRAQLAGWRGIYRDDVRVPGELPARMRALEVQQERWAEGGVQTARRLLPAIWRSDERLAVRLEATAHLAGHILHPVTLLLAAALALPAVAGAAGAAAIPGPVHAAALALAFLPFVLFYGSAAHLRGVPARALPSRVLGALGLGIGLGPPVAGAVLRGLGRRTTRVFRRTPKDGAVRAYAVSFRPVRTAVRLGLGALLLIAAGRLLASGGAGGVPFRLLFAAGYLATGALAVAEGRVGRQEEQERTVDEEGEPSGERPGAGGLVGVEARVAQEDEAAPQHPGPIAAEERQRQHPEQVPGVNRGGEEERGPQDPEGGALDRPSPHGRQARDPGHEDGGRGAGPVGIAQRPGQDAEQARVEPPAVRVRGQTSEHGAPRPDVGKVEEGGEREPQRRGRQSPAAAQGGKDGGRGELDRGAGPEEEAGGEASGTRTARPGAAADGAGQDEQGGHDRKDAEGLQMAAPGHLHDHERGPQPQGRREGRWPAAPGGEPVQDPTDGEVGRRPGRLEQENRGAEGRQRRERELGPGRIDGPDARVVDERPPGGGDRVEHRGGRGVRVRVDPVDRDPPVPQVAPDVVREVWGEEEEGGPEDDRSGPHRAPGERRPLVPRGRGRVQEEGRRPQAEGGPGSRRGSGRHTHEEQDGGLAQDEESGERSAPGRRCFARSGARAAHR